MYNIVIILNGYILLMTRDGNGTGSGRGAPLPTPSRLFKAIHIPVPFKKLNGTGRGEAGGYATFPYPPRLFLMSKQKLF